jgi:hypothetical protein
MHGPVRTKLTDVAATVSPEVRTGKVLEVQGTYVVLQGWIDPRGQVTNFHYELGTTSPTARTRRSERSVLRLLSPSGKRGQALRMTHYRPAPHGREDQQRPR